MVIKQSLLEKLLEDKMDMFKPMFPEEHKKVENDFYQKMYGCSKVEFDKKWEKLLPDWLDKTIKDYIDEDSQYEGGADFYDILDWVYGAGWGRGREDEWTEELERAVANRIEKFGIINTGTRYT